MGVGQNHTDSKGPTQDFSEARCECGQLVAKLGLTGVELKCKRCKRLVSIPFSSFSPAVSEVTIQLCENPPLSKSPV
jgi:phage FluMu protein Com